jgi:hypothetical protein
MTANANVEKNLGPIPAFTDTRESEGRQMQQFTIKGFKKIKRSLCREGFLFLPCNN